MSNEETQTPTAKPRRRLVGFIALALVPLFAIGAAFAGGPGKHFGPHARFAEDPQAAAAFVASKIANNADASDEQEVAIRGVIEDLFVEMAPMRAEKQAFRDEVKQALLADTVDPAELEALRARGVERAEDASVLMTDALGELAGILDAEQRATLAAEMEQMHQRLSR